MKKNTNTEKREYTSPVIERIMLDYEIALQLESTPPESPGEVHLQVPEYFNNDPFKINIT